MQLFFLLAALFLLTTGGSLTLYLLMRLSFYEFIKGHLMRAREERTIYRPEIGHLYGFALVGSITAILMAYLMLGNPAYGLPAIPLISLLSLPIVAYQRDEKRFRAERQAISFLHGLHGLTQGGVALPTAIHCLTEGRQNDFDVTLQKRLQTFSQGQSIREILVQTRKRLGLRSVDVCLSGLELAYDRGLSISSVLSEVVPAIEAEAEMLKRIRNLRKSVAVQAALASALPWGLLGVFHIFQPDSIAFFLATPVALFIIGASVIWMGMGVMALWQISEYY